MRSGSCDCWTAIGGSASFSAGVETALDAQVIVDDEPGVGPCDQDRAVQEELVDHGGDVGGPQLRLL